MTILVREEEKKDYRRVEEITRFAFSYQGRVERGGIGCPYEHWMVNEDAKGGRFFESDIYNDELNRERVKVFDEQFMRKEKNNGLHFL